MLILEIISDYGVQLLLAGGIIITTILNKPKTAQKLKKAKQKHKQKLKEKRNKYLEKARIIDEELKEDENT